MKTAYNYNTVLTWDPRDEIWVARVPELPGCMAHGDTQQEALEELQNAIPGWIEAAQEAHFSFTRPLPSIQTMKKASSLLNTAEVARLLGMAPRTLNARLKNGTPFKRGEAERLRDALAEHSLALM